MTKISNNILKISKIPKTCKERYLNLDLDCASYFKEEGICFSGLSKLRRGYQVGSPEPGPKHMIIITVSGRGALLAPEREYNLAPNSLICVPAGNPCMWKPRKDKWEIIWFYITPQKKWHELSEKGIQCFETKLAKSLEFYMELYLKESMSHAAFSRKAAENCSELTIINLKRALKVSGEKIENEDSKNFNALLQKVRNEPSIDWNAKKMAEDMNMSQATLQRLSQKLYGKSPKQLVINIKMEQARLLLNNTNYPMKIIADKLDYSDEFVFSNAFKRKFGVSPKFFRQKNGKM
jgi:AraC-like DNA-binding protein